MTDELYVNQLLIPIHFINYPRVAYTNPVDVLVASKLLNIKQLGRDRVKLQCG